jgi:RNA ligase (TIGR02306 family)
MSNIERKMATIRRISEINPIPDADAIEVATVDGWKVVVKKDEFKVNDAVIYCEIDSWIPTELAPFLSKGKEPREYNGLKGERLRTVKLRGQISQGLILPIPTGEHFDEGRLAFEVAMGNAKEGEDVSSILGIQKYEAPIPACLGGVVRGNFPSFIPKTDQERIQNLTKVFENYKQYNFEVSEKYDGSSCTIYYNNGETGVCSRNLDLKFDENNTFWQTTLKFNVIEKLESLGRNIAIQGELCGEGIQKNPYAIKGHNLYVFDIYDIDTGKYLSADERIDLVYSLDLLSVPIIEPKLKLDDMTIDDVLTFAEGKSILNPRIEREGLVFKCIENPDISFKAISNKFLLGEK